MSQRKEKKRETGRRMEKRSENRDKIKYEEREGKK